jgi:hypothetical protein
MDTDLEIGDREIEAGPHILIDSPEAQRELGRRNTPIDLEETQEDSKSIMKIPYKTTSVAHECHTKT